MRKQREGILTVAGIDPGSRHLGIAVVRIDQGGHPEPVESLEQPLTGPTLGHRLALVEKALHSMMERHKPAIVALETGYIGRDPKAGMILSEARGVARLCAHKWGTKVVDVTPQHAKAIVTGKGNAPKDRVARAVAMLLGFTAVPRENEADAYAIALAGSGINLSYGKLTAIV